MRNRKDTAKALDAVRLAIEEKLQAHGWTAITILDQLHPYPDGERREGRKAPGFSPGM